MFRIEYQYAESDYVARVGHALEEAEDPTVRDFVEDYRPQNSQLSVVIGDHRIKIDIGRDMSFLQETLLSLLESVTWGEASDGPYVEEASIFETRGPVYSRMLTIAYEPQYMFVSERGGEMEIATRTLRNSALVVAPEYQDVGIPFACGKQIFLREIHSFLNRYMFHLASAFPQLGGMDEFDDYIQALEDIGSAIQLPV